MDIVLAVALFLLTSGTAYLGVHVTLHPAESSRAKWGYKITFGVLTLVAAGLITWQNVLNRSEQGQLHAQLNHIQHNTEQPPTVQVNVPPPTVLTSPIPKSPASGVAFQEPNDSLRKRTIQAADSLYKFLIQRQQNHPPFAYPDSKDPNPSDERKKAIKLSQDYDQETQELYIKGYRDRMAGIIAEYESKGIPTGYLKSAAEQRPLGWGVVGSSWEGSPNDELTLFRNLAYRVDARDKAIYF